MEILFFIIMNIYQSNASLGHQEYVYVLEIEKGKYLIIGMELSHNGFGLGAVERKPVRWGNCAKPVLAAGGIFSTKV